ncbi:UNVERIFIED_CONTAM: hypothetical protein K2H54_054481 [Gekko kuhli]
MAAATALSSERLEVSIDGLTLSPDSEDARPGQLDVRPLPAGGSRISRAGTGGFQPGQEADDDDDAGGDSDDGALNLERRWGFGLEELYGLALRFFKGDQIGAPFPPSSGRKAQDPFMQYQCFLDVPLQLDPALWYSL